MVVRVLQRGLLSGVNNEIREGKNQNTNYKSAPVCISILKGVQKHVVRTEYMRVTSPGAQYS